MCGVDLLERAISFALSGLVHVTEEDLSRPTPCADWDLRALLNHLAESVDAVREGIEGGRIDLQTVLEQPVDPVALVRSRVVWLLGAWVRAGTDGDAINIGALPLQANVVAKVAALEITVHSWDIDCAGGKLRPIPPQLAAELLEFARLVVPRSHRYPLFGEQVLLPAAASPSDRLVAFLGRDPAIWRCRYARR